MVVRRPNGRLITAIKTFYPPGAFRLLTGGVGHGELIEAALLREVAEETSLEVVVRRFLTVIEYQLDSPVVPGPPSVAPIDEPQTTGQYYFATFAFLLDEVGGTLESHDPAERIGAFREVAPNELPMMAEMFDRVDDRFDPVIGGSWGDWGRFRAVVHRVVYEALGVDDRSGATAAL